jgi:tetratricopeptide (TPR) repeat protein
MNENVHVRADQEIMEEEQVAIDEVQEQDPESLYAQGMAHYRQRRWQQARSCFEHVKELQPDYRGIDALLRELDIFIQLESVECRPAAEEAGGRTRASTAFGTASPLTGDRELLTPIPEEELIMMSSGPRWWIWPIVLVLAAALVSGAYMILVDPFGLFETDQHLEVRCRSQDVAQNWGAAIEECSRWLVSAPDNPEAINFLYKAETRLYEEALSYERAGHIDQALTRYRRLENHDPDYKDVGERIAELERRQDLDRQLAEARRRLDSRDYARAISTLLDLREADTEYRPGTISDYLIEAYIGSARRDLELAMAELQPATNNNNKGEDEAAEPTYVVTQSILNWVSNAVNNWNQAFEVRPNSEYKQEQELAQLLLQGLKRYSDWGWQDAVSALEIIHQRNPGYFGGKAALLLCDARLHLGNFLLSGSNYEAALAQFETMQDMAVCDGNLALARAEEAGLPLTPTATPTNTPTPTPTFTPTQTPTPTMTPTPEPTSTPEPEPTDVPEPTPEEHGPAPQPRRPDPTKPPEPEPTREPPSR